LNHSFSSLDTFAKCQRQHFYKYREKRLEGPAPQLVVGIVYHEALARLLQTRRLPADAEVAGWFKAQETKPFWDRNLNVEKSTTEIQHTLRRVEQEVLPWLTAKEVETWLPRGGEYTGKVDAVLEETPVVDSGAIVDSRPGVCILDWKTVESAAKAARNATYKDHGFQLAMYAIPLGIRAGCIVEVPRDGVSAINTSVFSFDDAFVRHVQAYVTAQIAAADQQTSVEMTALAPWGHPLCCAKYCAYWKGCAGGGAK
jgi:hypothetical protein